MSAVKALRNIVSPSREAAPKPTAVELAARALETAQSELASERAAQAEAIAAAKAEFERDVDDERLAGALFHAERRGAAKIAARQSKVEQATRAHAELQAAERAARLAELDDTLASLRQRVQDAGTSCAAHLQAVLAAKTSVDTMIDEALRAADEASQLRGQSRELRSTTFATIRATGNLLPISMADAIGKGTWFELRRFFE